MYRYEANFARAWAAYLEAEAIFQETKSWPWLGMLYQEMAICLHQAGRERLVLVQNVDDVEDQADLALELIERSLDICRDFNVRAYPSALNRAGRIFAAAGQIDAGLQHLDEGINEAVRLGDGWFSSANNIEYVEHAYRAWTDTDEGRYRALVDERRARVAAVVETYRFRDIAARWELLQGHLITTDALRSGDNERSRHCDRALLDGIPDPVGRERRVARLCGHRAGVRTVPRAVRPAAPGRSSEVGTPA